MTLLNEARAFQVEVGQQPQRNELQGGNQSLVSTLRSVLRQSWKFSAVALVSLVGYWLLYATSSGMVFYYEDDVTPLLEDSPVPNPYFYLNFHRFVDFYNSGMIWFPNGHLQLNLLFGPTVFSVALSTLFALNMVLLAYSLSVGRLGKRVGTGGFLGMLPALFSGGCCSIPFGVLFISTFITPSTALAGFAFTYAFLTNIVVATVMLAALLYISRKIRAVSCPPRRGLATQQG